MKLKCKVCGRTFYKEDEGWGQISEGYAALGSLFAEKICPDCKRAKAFSGGSNSGGSNNGDSEAARIKAEADREKAEAARKEEEAAREEEARKAAAHKEAIQNIKNYEFPADDSEFNRSVNNFCDDYLECNSGLFKDAEYKKAYVRRAENELRNLKDSNSAHYQKFNEAWSEAAATMKKNLKTKLIISGGIVGAFVIGLGIFLATQPESNFFMGAGVGLIFGLIFGSGPHILGKSKTDEE